MIVFKIDNKYYSLSKAKDLTKLIKKQIVDKNGNIKTVYVKIEETKDRNRNIKRFIELIRNSKTEHSITVDSEGNLLVYKEGKANQIRFTQQELRKLNGAKLSIHNHPVGNSFSPADISFLIRNKIQEIKVVGMLNNKKVNYSLKLLKNLNEKEIKEIEENIIKIFQNKNKDLQNKIFENKINKIYAETNFLHLALLDLSKKYKDVLHYEKI
jgi:hypothetical protein